MDVNILSANLPLLIAGVAAALFLIAAILWSKLKSTESALHAILEHLSETEQKDSEKQLIEQLASVRADAQQLSANTLQHIAQQHTSLVRFIENRFAEATEKQLIRDNQLQQLLQSGLHSHKETINETLVVSLERVTEQHRLLATQSREEQAATLKLLMDSLAERMKELTEATDKRLITISQQVDKRLNEGLEKTNQTFKDILQRLTIIDDAQKRITELSGNVVSLQEVLSDKRSRGAFGEVQLSALVRNTLPEQHFAFQHTLSNSKIADCVLFLPPPTGNVVIDSKFPLENYRKMTDLHVSDLERQVAEKQFKQDIKKHVTDIANKYLIERETADGAIMFIPAEAIFAEIHAHHPDVVEFAYQKRIWLTSPTTLMAILTTARSVLKDEATREQVHIIQEHLGLLAKDFGRFQTRFDQLARHIDQAAGDVKQIHTSADKISKRFKQIESVELDHHDKISMIEE